MILIFIILAGLGFYISFMAYLLEKKIKKNHDYKPFCDISNSVSCSKPITSEYANLLVVSNSILGMIFYTAVIFLASINATKLLLLATSAGFIMTCFLAYILFVKIRTACMLCISVYFINSALFACALYFFWLKQ